MAGRSMSRCASTAAAVADVSTASTCSTAFSASPNAACAPDHQSARPNRKLRILRTATSLARTAGRSVSPTDVKEPCHMVPKGLMRTLSARSMPIFIVPADDGQVPHAPWQPQQGMSSHSQLRSCKRTTSASKGENRQQQGTRSEATWFLILDHPLQALHAVQQVPEP